jgi:hypothetical protein
LTSHLHTLYYKRFVKICTTEYMRGKGNKASDALSRVQMNNDIIDAYAIPTDQHTGHDM